MALSCVREVGHIMLMTGVEDIVLEASLPGGASDKITIPVSADARHLPINVAARAV